MTRAKPGVNVKRTKLKTPKPDVPAACCPERETYLDKLCYRCFQFRKLKVEDQDDRFPYEGGW